MDWSNLIGRSLGDDGEYEIIAELGRGASSHIYHAWDRIAEHDVAIKVIPNDTDDRASFVHRFEREVQAIEPLRHPNIVEVYGKGETDDLVYLVMQCVTGGTLQARLAQPLPVSEAVGAAIQMAHALHHAHEHGVIHRDVKPANILVDADNSRHLLLADFGIAKIQGMRGLTKSGMTIGTPEYMAPEQAAGDEVDYRADVYALGCVLYEALAGKPPFVGSTPVSILYQHVHVRPASLRDVNAAIPRELEDVVQQALAKRPEDRFDTVKAFAQALYPYTESHDSHDAALTVGTLTDAGIETARGGEGPAATESGHSEQPGHDWGAEGLDALFSGACEGRAADVLARAPQAAPQAEGSAVPVLDRTTIQLTHSEPSISRAAQDMSLSTPRRGTPVLDAPLELPPTQPTPPQKRTSFSTLATVFERGAAPGVGSRETTDELVDEPTAELPGRPPRGHSWDADEPDTDEHDRHYGGSSGGSSGGGAASPSMAPPASGKRFAPSPRMVALVALALALISGAAVISQVGRRPGESASSISSSGVVDQSTVASTAATSTSGAVATGTPVPAGTTSATAAITATSAPSAVPSATMTSTPLPPRMTVSPNPWSLSQNGLLSSQCSSGSVSQTLTNTGAHAVSWAWQSSGAPSPSADGLQYSLNGGSGVTGLPSHASLTAGGKDTLAIQMNCTSRTYTVSVLVTDLVTGSQTTVTFQLQVPGGF